MEQNRLKVGFMEKSISRTFEASVRRNIIITNFISQIQSPYLEPYLKRQASLQPDHIAMLDLLWRHYEKSRNFSAAARILAKLADRHRYGWTR